MGSIYREASTGDCGYIMELAGKKLYQPGDTVLLQEHLEMGEVDILFVSPTEHNTFIEQSVKMISLLNPAYIFPQHFNTFKVSKDNAFWTMGFPQKLFESLSVMKQKCFHQMEQGEIFNVPKG
jgi:L-ascorbate metabolism protein UlaG (beta-lactamase superfamily)